MEKSNVRWKCLRYEFHGGVLKEAQPLEFRGGYFYQTREDFPQYCKSINLYLNRLVGADRTEPENCPFCSLEISPEQSAYLSSRRVYPFVDQSEVHLKLWESGIIVIPNSAGWHLVSELVVPRSHLTGSIGDNHEISKALFEACTSRWFVHITELLRVASPSIKELLYHGIVFNQQVGQSVSHSHLHCYSTIHPLRHFRSWLHLPFVCNTTTIPSFQIRASGDDHPNLIASCRLPTDKTKEMTPILCESGLLSQIHSVLNHIQISIYGSNIPASMGWFLTFNPTPFLVHAIIPIKRRGTLQAFQGDRFRKFKTQVVLSSIKNIIRNA